jgi:hypothetical protein
MVNSERCDSFQSHSVKKRECPCKKINYLFDSTSNWKRAASRLLFVCRATVATRQYRLPLLCQDMWGVSAYKVIRPDRGVADQMQESTGPHAAAEGNFKRSKICVNSWILYDIKSSLFGLRSFMYVILFLVSSKCICLPYGVSIYHHNHQTEPEMWKVTCSYSPFKD